MILWVLGELLWEVLALPVMLALAVVIHDLSGLQGPTRLTIDWKLILAILAFSTE